MCLLKLLTNNNLSYSHPHTFCCLVVSFPAYLCDGHQQPLYNLLLISFLLLSLCLLYDNSSAIIEYIVVGSSASTFFVCYGRYN